MDRLVFEEEAAFVLRGGERDDAVEFEEFEDVFHSGGEGVKDELAAGRAKGTLGVNEPTDGGGVDAGDAFHVDEDALGGPIIAEEIVEVVNACGTEIDGGGFAFSGEVGDAVVFGEKRERKRHAGLLRRDWIGET
jgi:hypothetical protein